MSAPVDRPILCMAHMVRAILAGTKTQTRRIVKPQPTEAMWDCARAALGGDTHKAKHAVSPTLGLLGLEIERGGLRSMGFTDPNIRCPFGRPGDRLWVRETWVELLHTSPATDEPVLREGDKLIEPATSYLDRNGRTRWNYDGRVIAYRATSDVEFCDGDGFAGDFANRDDMPRWRPSIHMPRWASRITLEITDVRVERLHEISEEDARAEGVTAPARGWTPDNSACDAFFHLWSTIYGDESFEANPWVWSVSFRRVMPEGGAR